MFDVAESANSVTVDESTCEQQGAGADTLCDVWTDPSYDPKLPTFYYARILETPTCRWSWRDCLTISEADRPPACTDPNIAHTIQERAWTSPIWVDAS